MYVDYYDHVQGLSEPLSIPKSLGKTPSIC